MNNFLYHFPLNTSKLNSILNSDHIKMNRNLSIPSVSLTRNPNYLNPRGIRIVLDKDRLKHRYKISPFCFYGWHMVNEKEKFGRFRYKDEMEERVMNDIQMSKHCIRIDIDSTLISIDRIIENPLVNYIEDFEIKYRFDFC